MTLQYEDTVQPEIAPCADCGKPVDEGDCCWVNDDKRICPDCWEDRVDAEIRYGALGQDGGL